jgi:hypothetical protein
MIENNPLRQYFRKPTMYFKLPSNGDYYDAGVVNFPPNRELPVYPMTALDEITIRTPDGLFNGAAVVDLIKSCVPNIIDPWKLNNIDLDATLMAIKSATGNGKLAMESTCPACNEVSSYDINLISMLNSTVNVNYLEPLQVQELEIKFRPLTYTETNQNGIEQLEVQKMLVAMEMLEDEEQKKSVMNEAVKRLNDVILKIVCNTIAYIKTPESIVTDKAYIMDFMNNCDKNMNNAIRDYSIELREQSNMKPIHIKCIHCQHDYDQRLILNATDFFD